MLLRMAFDVGPDRGRKVRRHCYAALLALALGACATGGVDSDSGASPRDAGARDAGSLPDAHRADAQLPDAGPADAALPPVDAAMFDAGNDAGMFTLCAPTATTIHIVELMQRSAAGADDRGEWFEVLNSGDCTIDMNGVVIVSPNSSGTEMSATVTSGVIPSGARFVLARSGNSVENHGLPRVGFAYGVASGVVLDNSTDWLELRLGRAVLDRVEWTSTDVFGGGARAWRFPDDAPPSMSSSRALWCFARDSQVYSTGAGGPFYGSPGEPNLTCP